MQQANLGEKKIFDDIEDKAVLCYANTHKDVLAKTFVELNKALKLEIPVDDDIQQLTRDEAFKFAIKTFAACSDIGNHYSKYVTSAFLEEIHSHTSISQRSGKAFANQTELMVHLPKDVLSMGQFHVDSSHQEDFLMVNCWHPLFETTYPPLCFKHNQKVQSINLKPNQYMYFRGDLLHRGNFNYTQKPHCAVVTRINTLRPFSTHFHEFERDQNGIFHCIYSPRSSSFTLQDLILIAKLAYNFLSNIVDSRQINKSFASDFVNNLTSIKPDAFSWYAGFFGCGYWPSFLEKICCMPDSGINIFILNELLQMTKDADTAGYIKMQIQSIVSGKQT